MNTRKKRRKRSVKNNSRMTMTGRLSSTSVKLLSSSVERSLHMITRRMDGRCGIPVSAC